MRLSLIVAMDENGLIGADNGMPWHLPNDLKHFKRTTTGKPILMGRRTHESIGKALPGRQNVIISRDSNYRAEGCYTVTTMQAAGDAVQGPELVVIGGAQIYQMALPEANTIYLTRIHDKFEGDTWFPEFDAEQWQEQSCERHMADAKNPHDYSFIVLQRRD